jgi:mannose-6-phosphate isomerase-like protein (cupin superfamily)
MPSTERISIIQNLKVVDHCILFNDNDGSAREAIRNVKMMYPNSQIVFANGGDRTAVNIPEMAVKDIIFKFGVGGTDKAGSSSDFLAQWRRPVTARPWGEYCVLYEQETVSRATKVKELTVEPGKSLSLQRHQHRNEFWHVVEGMCNVEMAMASGYALPPRTLNVHDRIDIIAGEWHRLTNPFTTPCKIVEIQYGNMCEEEDIERKSY